MLSHGTSASCYPCLQLAFAKAFQGSGLHCQTAARTCIVNAYVSYWGSFAQWTGGTIGMSVLVTIYGVAARGTVPPASDRHSPVQAAHYVLIHGMNTAFFGGVFIVLASLLVTLAGVRAVRDAQHAAAGDGHPGSSPGREAWKLKPTGKPCPGTGRGATSYQVHR